LKTREQFIAKFRTHVAAMALFGVVSEAKDGLLARAGKVLEIPAETDKLLIAMYQYLMADLPVAPEVTSERKTVLPIGKEEKPFSDKKG
jgi:hypothetical protein